MELKAVENSEFRRKRRDLEGIAKSKNGTLISHGRDPADGRDESE
jgi:hypothetical protein